jgi:hypothetical protein
MSTEKQCFQRVARPKWESEIKDLDYLQRITSIWKTECSNSLYIYRL